MSPNSNPTFPGYTMMEQLGETHASSVYRARKTGEDQSVIIKLIRIKNTSPETIARFRHEYELIKRIDLDGIVRPIDFLSYEGSPALVLEDFGGTSLMSVIEDGVSLGRFLSIAIRISTILGELHQLHVSHRDIKPHNILINSEEDVIKITDFGISVAIEQDHEEFAHSAEAVGSLAYISPEQTGRINCGVDYRTDMYSLGVTFYEMLTGVRPFYSKDPLEMIHSHIAKIPESPSMINPDIPDAVSDIVMKLMAKSAQDRYQNCKGLCDDLELCLRQWNESGRINSFEIGKNDVSSQFTLPDILVGREGPLAELHAAYDRVCGGSVEVVLVSGEPGIGKSVLVQEMRKPVLDKRGYFIFGKFDQYQRAVPYSAVIQAIQSLIRQILAESDEQLKAWNTKLSAALGKNGKVIADIIPEIELIIGRQSKLPDLGPEESQNRFNFVFKNFIRVFADINHPMVLFLDDIQWADVATLNLMATIVTDNGLNSLFLIGAYRHTEMTDFHPFRLTSDIIKSSDIPLKTLKLEPLDGSDVSALIQSFVHCPPGKIEPLARLIHKKTKGSPFFINQFLKTIYEKSYLSVDSSLGWTWNLQMIQDMEATENVVSFMAGKLHELFPSSLEIIKLASCIGNQFDLESLTAVSKRSLDDILSIIENLIKEGMVIKDGHRFRFYHDRIQEAAYSMLFAGERETIHYQVGMLELERTPSFKLSNRIFFICDQLNQAGLQLNDREQKRILAELNLKAGIKAKESTAYSAAATYLKAGCDLLPDESWDTDYTLTYSLYIEHMECCYLNRDTGEAERLFSIILEHAKTKSDKGRAYAIMVVLYTSSKTSREAIDLGLEGLRIFGVDLKANMGKMPVLAELVKVKYRLKKLGVENILELPAMVDEELIVIHELMLSIGVPAYYVNQNLYAWVSLKGFNDYIKHGLVPYSGAGCVVVASIIQTAFGDYDLAYRLGTIALKLSEGFDFVRYAGMVNHIFGFFIAHWKEPVKNNLERYKKSFELSMNSGNLIFAAHSISVRVGTRFILNHRIDDMLNDLDSYLEFISHLDDPHITCQYQMQRRYMLTLKGTMDTGQELSDSEFDFNERIEFFRNRGNLFGLCYALFTKSRCLSLDNRFEEALNVLEELDRIIHVVKGTLLEVDHHYFYSLSLINSIREGAGRKKRRYLARVKRNLKKLGKWADQCPENFMHKYELVLAELKGIEVMYSDAVDYYHKAITSARTQGYLYNEALASELTASFYFRRGYNEEGRTFIVQAYKAYASWGATARVENLMADHKELLGKTDLHEVTDSLSGTSSSGSIIHNLDFNTVMKVSQVISGEIKLDRLLIKTMHMSITNSGAQRGYLIFETDGSLFVQASEDVGTKEAEVLQRQRIEDCNGICPAIVNYVYHSGEKVILDDASNRGPFTNDSYIVDHKCKSILCVPVKNKGHLTCIFYMENNLAHNVFTDERLQILRVIFAQVAISLQNARLYDEISSEIAVRKQAEEHMRSSENKYKTILEELQDIYCETNISGNMTFINPAGCYISGYHESDLIGSSFRKLFHESDQKNLENYYQEIKSTCKAGKPLSCQLITKNGDSLPLEILTSPILNKKNQIVGFRNVARDVSDRIRLEKDLIESSKNVHAARSATILGLAKLAEYRDEDTGTHLERIREYSRMIALELAMKPEYSGYITDDYVEDIYNSAILHDIGKVGVPDAILLKPGKLTHDEFEIIKTHTTLGGEALKTVENQIEGQTFLTLGKEIAYFHHEKWDGTGYPKGLKGTDIPLSARIVALADVYDALTSKRVYKEAFSHEKARGIIVQGRGSHFDPDVVDAFITHEDEFRKIREELFEEES